MILNVFLKKEDIEKIIGDCLYSQKICQYNDSEDSFYIAQTFKNENWSLYVDEFLLDNDELCVTIFYNKKPLINFSVSKERALVKIEKYYKKVKEVWKIN